MPNPEEEYKNLVSQIQSQNIKITPEIEALAEKIWNSPGVPTPRQINEDESYASLVADLQSDTPEITNDLIAQARAFGMGKRKKFLGLF